MISLIVPIYNAAPYIKDCLDDIKNQTSTDFEVILIDDGSTDETWRIIQEQIQGNNQFKAFHKENEGVSSARNYGLKVAKGDYICWMDVDDHITENYISDLYFSLTENPDADLIIQSFNRIENRRCKSVSGVRIGFYNIKEDFNLFFDGVELGNFGISMSKLFKRSLIEKNQLRYSTNIVLGEDLDFLLRYIASCQHIYCSQNVNYNYIVRVGSASKTTYPFYTLQKGLQQIDGSWLQVCKTYPCKSVEVLRKKTAADYVHRMIISCYKEGVTGLQRRIDFKTLQPTYRQAYKEQGDKSTMFLKTVNYLFCHEHYICLDVLMKFVYRYVYHLN